MGIERQHTPQYWRNRAEEFHAKADSAEHRQTKETMRKAAQVYEDLARRAEQIRTMRDLAVTGVTADPPARP